MPPSTHHILHLSAASTWRGGERQLAYLVEELAKKGVQQTVFCPAGSPLAKWCGQTGTRFFTYRKMAALDLAAAWRVRHICLRRKITHLHAHDSHSHTTAVLAFSLFGAPAKIIVHRRVDFPIGGSFFSKWKYNHPAVQAIICVSHFIKKRIAPAISHPEKIHVVHDGIELTAPHNSQPIPAMLSGQNSQLLIGNIAAIAPHKDYFTFVRTADILLKGGLSAKFLLIGGDGGEATAIRNFIEEKKLTEHLEMTGFRADVPALLQQLDLLLFTSKTEGLGSAILDAFVAEVPVVATTAGGIPELVEDGVTGLLAPAGDAEKLAAQVLRMLEDAPLRQAVLANAKEKATLFSKERMAAAVLKIYG